MNNSNQPRPDRPPPGLEEHLHNLIISNQSNEQRQAVQQVHIGIEDDVARPDQGLAPTVAPAVISSTTRAGGKKRPNQAQRRQMNAQLVLDVDTRAVEPPLRHQNSQGYRGGHGQHGSSQHFANQRDMTSHARQAFGHQPWRSQESNNPNGRWSHNQSSQSGYHPRNQQQDHSFRRHQAQSQSFRSEQHFQGQPHQHHQHQLRPEEIAAQSALLEKLCYNVVSGSEIEFSEIAEKEGFRQRIEHLSREVITMHEVQGNSILQFPPQSVELKCFGSLSSGFATKASDMDLGLLTPLSAPQPDAADSPIPRLLEKALLDAGVGARLLTKTRVPIIKLCERPPAGLLHDLRTERQKWETGLSKDDVEVTEDTTHADHAPSADEDEDREPLTTDEEVAPEYYFDVPSKGGGTAKRFWLKQNRDQTLLNYQGTAKRVLRKAGGRDVTLSNFRELTVHEWDVLNCICRAFVQGLANVKLRDNLQTWPSLSFAAPPGIPDRHSLMAVSTQVEGEDLLLRWDEKIAQSGMSPKPRHGRAVLQWNELRMRETYGSDPLSWAKELQLSLEKVKKLPSVQLITLEQQQSELPAAYHARAKAVVRVLEEHNQEPAQIMVTQYIDGIQPSNIRRAVSKAYEETARAKDLDAIGRLHKALHLAAEFEQAVVKNLYEETVIEDVKAYINLLRAPMVNLSISPISTAWVIPIGPEDAALIARVQSLKDPHTFTINQPKDRYKDKLEFPKTGVGAQCDINFSAHLALQNTLLLRCYSHTDPRVRPMVLFIKHWAKVRGINSGYRGTLSSYGYVLMVLHYLVNVAKPFVCPNLQQLGPQEPPNITPAQAEGVFRCRGYNVAFWRNEEEILHLARSNQLTHNKDPLGHLLRGFFEYFAHTGMMSDGSGRAFDWGRDVLSLRNPGGLLSKQEKGWTGAKTTVEVRGTAQGPKTSQHGDVASPISPITPQQQIDPVAAAVPDAAAAASKATAGGEVKEVRHRYLFAIEDPFELEHNVARTVTHNGIVSIRDEFRRAWRIIRAAGQGVMQEDLLKDVNAVEEGGKSPYLALLDDIHGLAGTALPAM